jgi:hypothetical protein
MEDKKDVANISPELLQTGTKISSDFSIKWYTLLAAITNFRENDEKRIKQHQIINQTLVDECEVTANMKYLPEMEIISDLVIKYKKERNNLSERLNSTNNEIVSFTNSISELNSKLQYLGSESDEAKKINQELKSFEERSKLAEKEKEIIEVALEQYTKYIEGQQKYSDQLVASFESFFELCHSLNSRNGAYISSAYYNF